MQKISLEETQKLKNSDLCQAIIYPFEENKIDISTATIRGRYPEKGYCVNTKVKEMIYVIQGGGISTSKADRFHLKKAMLF